MNPDIIYAPKASLKEAVDINNRVKQTKRVADFEMPDVKGIREKLNLTQEQFAEGLAYSVETIKSWEQGRRNNPSGISRKVLLTIARNPAVYWEIAKS